MSDERTFLMLGLPEHGKTSFLAALWNVLEAGDVAGALELARFSGDRTYLNAIRDEWLHFRSVSRTPSSSRELVELTLRSAESESTLLIPDLSGERLQGFLEHREWPAEFEDLVQRSSGTLLFVNPTHISEAARIVDLDSLVQAIDGTASTPVPTAAATFDVTAIPTQSLLVELLQLLWGSSQRGPSPTALIVSAWDVLRGKPPRPFLDKRMPFLTQFLDANGSRAQWSSWGVSAQGGDFATDRERLLKVVGSARIQVTDGTRVDSDISRPLRWLMDSEGE